MPWTDPDENGVMRNGQYSIKLLGKHLKIPVLFEGKIIGHCVNVKKAMSLAAYHKSERTGVK